MLPAVLLKKLCSSPSLCSSKIKKLKQEKNKQSKADLYVKSKCGRKAYDGKLFLKAQRQI